MIFAKIAFDNIFYNKRRTFLVMILIAISAAAIILFNAYAAWSHDGMKFGYIEGSGNFQIASKGYFDAGGDNKTLDSRELKLLDAFLNGNTSVQDINASLNFSGIIGNEAGTVSTVFWGAGEDKPEMPMAEGLPLFGGKNAVILGKELAEKLGVVINNDKPPYVNLMSQSAGSALSLGSLDVSGTCDIGVPATDKGLVIAGRKTVLDFLNIDDAASYIKVKTINDDITPKVINELNDYAKKNNIEIDTRTWEELNPMYDQVDKMNNAAILIVSIILCAVIIASLAHAISSSFNERLAEFGTLEAIGLRKKKITLLLFFEVLFITAGGIILGIIISSLVSVFTSIYSIKIVFPGYSEGYAISFPLSIKTILYSVIFIVISCFIAVLSPISHVVRRSITTLMYHSE